MPLQQDRTLVVSVANDLAEIGRLAEEVDAFCERNGLDAMAHAFNLSFDELLTNTIHYGYDDAGSHEIEITLAADGDRMTATIQDDGRAFDPTVDAEAPDIDADLDDRPIGGLGIFLVKEMMDEIRYERVGAFNRVTLMKRAGD